MQEFSVNSFLVRKAQHILYGNYRQLGVSVSWNFELHHTNECPVSGDWNRSRAGAHSGAYGRSKPTLQHWHNANVATIIRGGVKEREPRC